KRRFDEAREALKSAAAIEASWADARASEARAEIDAMKRAYDGRREQMAGEFSDFYGCAVLTAGLEGGAAAPAVVPKGAARFDAFSTELSVLRDDLDLLARNGTDPGEITAGSERGALAKLLAHLALGEMVQAERTVEVFRARGGDAEEAKARVARVRGALR